MAGFSVTDVQKHLAGASYPSSGPDLASLAEGNGADSELVEALEGLGEVDGPDKVMQQLQPLLGDDGSE